MSFIKGEDDLKDLISDDNVFSLVNATFLKLHIVTFTRSAI